MRTKFKVRAIVTNKGLLVLLLNGRYTTISEEYSLLKSSYVLLSSSKNVKEIKNDLR